MDRFLKLKKITKTEQLAQRGPLSGCALMLLTFSFLALGGCTGKSPAAAAGATREPVAVKVAVAKPEPVSIFSEYIATLKSRNSAVLQSQVEGQITAIYVKSGDGVRAGAPLMQIDPLKQQAAVSTEQANEKSRLATLELARTELERAKELAAAGVVSRQVLDQASSAYNTAKANVDAMKASLRAEQVQLRYYRVSAPAAGVIGDVPVHVGDRVTTQTILTTIDKGGELEAYIAIPAEKSVEVRPGTEVEVLSEGGKVAASTRVSFISPQVDPSTQSLLVKATIANRNNIFRTAQNVRVRVIWSKRDLPLIPVSAVSRLGGQVFAFVAEGDGGQLTARQRTIQVGDIVGNQYPVLDGIKPGDKIIITGVQTLADGVPVTPQS